MTDAVLPPQTAGELAESFVAVSALVGCHDVVSALEDRVPLAKALLRASDRAARARLLADALGRIAREAEAARP